QCRSSRSDWLIAIRSILQPCGCQEELSTWLKAELSIWPRQQPNAAVLPKRESDIIALRGLVLPGLRLTMPCFILLVLLLFPRVALVLMWIYSTYLQRAFHGGLVLPVLGFIFLPLTTIVYAWEVNSGMPTAGINLLWLLIAVVIDLGGLGGGAHRQSRRW
ncbi:MAG: hypothetical protein ABSE42_22045, partial [Bryobacteraceae bacterium]